MVTVNGVTRVKGVFGAPKFAQKNFFVFTGILKVQVHTRYLPFSLKETLPTVNLF